MSKQKFRNSILIFTAILLFLNFCFSRFSSQKFYPSSEGLKMESFHEMDNNDFSRVKASVDSNQKIHLTYQLSATKSEPFAGFFLYKKDSVQPFFELNKYNAIKIHIKSNKGKRIPITLAFDYKGFTSAQRELSTIPFTAVIEYNGEKEYTVPLSEFKEQDWWFRFHRKKINDFPKVDFDRGKFLIIGSCQALKGGLEDEIVISSIKFFNDNTVVYLTFSILLLVGWIVFFVYYQLVNKKKVFIPYVIQEIQDNSNSKLEMVVQFVATHYDNPELDQVLMQKQLGISAREIGLLLKNNFNTTFKNYVTEVRLTEIKRLLKEGETPISDIAYQCGFKNITHFNRVFKNETGLNPKKYREMV